MKRKLPLLLWIGLGLAAWFASLPGVAGAPQERLIRVDASSYEYSPGVIHANRGDRITLELASKDVVHGVYIDGYQVSLSADPGQPQRVSFTADQAG
ncbi:MAG: hypothetical protein L0Z70_17100, partial [Chloroflexi bacterium]|nr:hypothetical protein [Chloroflexota bacterium]